MAIAKKIEKKQTRKPRLLLDIDGCITKYDFRELVFKYFKVDITGLVISAYDLADFLGVSNLAIDIMFKDTVWGKPEFQENALSVLNEWKQKGYELAIHSSRVNYMGEIGLVSWLIDNKIPFSGIDTTGKAKEYDVQIDDRPSKLKNANSKLKLLYDTTYNQSCANIEQDLIRVYNWVEIKRFIEGLG
jgi:uncharacterized HAD superfamily protein